MSMGEKTKTASQVRNSFHLSKTQKMKAFFFKLFDMDA